MNITNQFFEKPEGIDKSLKEVQVGETIVVAGYLFVLTDFHNSVNEPPYVTFKSPVEMMEK